MSIDPKYLNLFIKATEKGAIGASKFIGKKDKIAADKGAVDLMRKELNKINMEGTVVIGEGEMDEAPMLYIGEKLGTLNGPKFDIAKEMNCKTIYPDLKFCGDNAAMIAWAGIKRFKKNLIDNIDTIARSRWPLDKSAPYMKGPGLKL